MHRRPKGQHLGNLRQILRLHRLYTCVEALIGSGCTAAGSGCTAFGLACTGLGSGLRRIRLTMLHRIWLRLNRIGVRRTALGSGCTAFGSGCNAFGSGCTAFGCSLFLPCRRRWDCRKGYRGGSVRRRSSASSSSQSCPTEITRGRVEKAQIQLIHFKTAAKICPYSNHK